MTVYAPGAVGADRADGEGPGGRPLRIRWLGRMGYREALSLQEALWEGRRADHLLLLEHPHVYTLGVRARPEHLLVDPATVGAEVIPVRRGGDVTYHGPGQLVGYPILTLPGRRGGGMADTVAYVTSVEQLLIDALAALGLTGVGRLAGHPGVWVDPHGPRPRKIAAIGVRLSRARTMHGFALNVDCDLGMFAHIIPCGIPDKPVTSLAAEGIRVPMREVVDAVAAAAAGRWGHRSVERQDVAWRVRRPALAPFSRSRRPTDPPGGPSARLGGRLAEAGVPVAAPTRQRKPAWLRARVRHGPEVLELRRRLRDARLVTVCEEAGCPNLSECWSEGTATFMINGDRCTRACGFCLVDTRAPLPPDEGEPDRVADAVAAMELDHVVVTAVARDDLPDGGASGFAATVGAIRRRVPGCRIEVLIPDFGGSRDALDTVLEAGPDVVNHNVETVPRLQRAVRPSAGYGRSLAVLARASAAGMVTKSGIIVGMGETDTEVAATMADLAAVGTDIVTIGQYLRPSSRHLPVARWVHPERFAWYVETGRRLGLRHVVASPLTRSSHHARAAADAVVGAG